MQSKSIVVFLVEWKALPVSSDPANVGNATKHVPRLEVEDLPTKDKERINMRGNIFLW